MNQASQTPGTKNKPPPLERAAPQPFADDVHMRLLHCNHSTIATAQPMASETQTHDFFAEPKCPRVVHTVKTHQGVDISDDLQRSQTHCNNMEKSSHCATDASDGATDASDGAIDASDGAHSPTCSRPE